jgi:hypothetical protein
LFRLITEGNLKFKNEGKLRQIYVPIDEDLEYFGLTDFLNKSIKDATGKPTEKYRIAWELFILNRVILELRFKFKGDGEISSIENEFAKSIGLDVVSKLSLLELLRKTKKTFGVKLENGHTGFVVPNFYTSIEPSNNSAVDGSSEASLMLDTVSVKRKIREFLKNNKAVVFVLIDKLDEFVANSEYAMQKINLQSLLETQRSYQAFSEIKIKLFLRTDLFRRLDFESLGYDKISSKTVELKWSQTDIRQFIAKRILHNLSSVLDKKKFGIKFDDKKLYVDQEYLKKGSQIDIAYTNKRENLFYIIKKWAIEFQISRNLRKRDKYDARQTDLMAAIYRMVITLFFPNEVKHYNKKRKKESLDIFDFLDSHLSLASGSTTPRIVLMHFQICLEHTREYYRLNPDTASVHLNEESQYPLLPRDAMLLAYGELQDGICLTFANLTQRWKVAALNMRENLPSCNKSTIVSYQDIAKWIKGRIEEEDFKAFVAFYSHVGLLRCINPTALEEKRNYELPILFQKLS